MKKLISLRKLLTEKHLEAFLVSSVEAITYFTDFAGFFKEDRDAYLLITQNNKYIFTHGIYKEAVEKKIKHFTLVAITREEPFTKQLGKLLTKHEINTLGFEANNLTVTEYLHMKKAASPSKLVASDALLSELRIEKTQEEIDAIEKACQVGDKAFGYILKQIHSGITEKELAFLLESYIKRHGDDISFPAIVAFGKNSSLPHHRPTNAKLKPGDFIVLDFGAKVTNYCSDMTRTVVFQKATDKQKHIYQTVREAQQKAIEHLSSEILHPTSKIKEEIRASDVDHIARSFIESQGFPNMPHSLGHGIGLAVHELPRLAPASKDILTPGMVFSIEPGIYLPDFGGVRIEDLVAKTTNGVKILTHSPNHLITV